MDGIDIKYNWIYFELIFKPPLDMKNLSKKIAMFRQIDFKWKITSKQVKN